MLKLNEKFINPGKQNYNFYFERRRYIRLQTTDMDIPISIKSSNNGKTYIKGKVINTGNEGLLTQIDRSIAISKKISFKFKLPEPYNSIEGNGLIKWGRENNDILYYGIKIDKFKDELSSAKFYDFLIEKGIGKDLNLKSTEKEKNEFKTKPLSDRIPKSKGKKGYDQRKSDRRKFQLLLNSQDRRISERRKVDRRNYEERRKLEIPMLKENRKQDRRKSDFFDYSKEFIEHRRNWLEQKLDVDLQNIGYYSLDTQKAKGNIENMIGVAQVPIGIAGPCKINGEYARGDFYIPLATTEGSLVVTFQRGMTAINLAGGANVKILKDKIHISPVFLLKNLTQCIEFEKWINEHFNEIKIEAEKTTRYGKLLSIESRITGDKVFLIFYYTTEDAAGQNMLIKSAEAACNYISTKTGYHYFLKSNLSANKKASWFNYINGYGKSVIAEVTISRDIMQRVFNINPEDIYDLYQAYVTAGNLTGIVGLNSQFANGIGALYLACGQDIAHIATAHSGLAYWECMKDNNLYVSVNMPSLMVGTVGGGTRLSTQKECLEIIDCYGSGKAKKFAEITAVTALAGEISLGSSLAYGTFGHGHLKYGR